MYGPDPTYYINKFYNSAILDPSRTISNYIFIAKNTFSNVDSIWPFASSMNGYYYDVDRIIKRPVVAEVHPEVLYSTSMMELGEHYVHNKSVYSLVDCLSDLGGLFEIILVVTGIFIKPL